MKVVNKVFVSIIALCYVVYLLLPEKNQLALRYNVSEEQVVIRERPHECDFDKAPFGNKECHYDKHIVVRLCRMSEVVKGTDCSAVNKEQQPDGRWVCQNHEGAIPDVPSRPEDSDDGGRTWSPTYDNQPCESLVSVYWEKVDD